MLNDKHYKYLIVYFKAFDQICYFAGRAQIGSTTGKRIRTGKVSRGSSDLFDIASKVKADSFLRKDIRSRSLNSNNDAALGLFAASIKLTFDSKNAVLIVVDVTL